jgi:hypothetical protein
MAINYGPTTKSYLAGLKLELAGLDKNSKTFDAQKSLIEAEVTGAEKNLKVEEKEAADREAAESE